MWSGTGRENCWQLLSLPECLLGSSTLSRSSCSTGSWSPAPARARASAVPLPPRAATFCRLRGSGRLHALPDFKNKQAPSPPRGIRGSSTSQRLPKLGSLLAGPGRDAWAVTPRLRRRNLGAPRASAVRLASALPSLRVTPSPAMQCQDCTALTHRLSSQLEKKRERGREATAKEDSLACYKGLHNSRLGALSAQRPAGARRTAASRNQLYHFISTTVSGLPLRQQAQRRPLPATK